MARTFRQPGNTLTWTNDTGADVASGDVVVLDDTIGIAQVDIADTEDGSVAIAGAHEVPKTTGTAWAQGEKLDWDDSVGEFVPGATPAAGDVLECGVAAADAAAADAVGEIRLTPGTGTLQ